SVEGTHRNRGGAGSARNLQGEILIPVGGVACLGGLSYAERYRLVPFRGERRGIHYQEQARTESAPCQSECDRCGSGAADQCRQLTRGDNPVRRNGTLNRQREDRGGEAFLIVLHEEPVGILVLRHELGTGRIPRHCGAVIPQHVQITWGCPRIAQQAALVFGIEIDNDTVRRIRTFTTVRNRMREVHPGSLFSATRRTVCRESIRFEASPLLYERVGLGSSRTNRRPGLRSRRHDSRPPPKSVSTSLSNNKPPVPAYTIAAAKAGGVGCQVQAQGGFY